MVVFDISRVHFMAPMDREACIELPQEEELPKDGDAVGLLLRVMYGFRTASANWPRDWQATLEQAGYKVGLTTPAFFYKQTNVAEAGVHGDEFCCGWLASSLGPDGKNFIWQVLMRESHRLGFGNHCERHAGLLKGVVSVGTKSNGRRYVRIEPDIRHAELEPLTTPGFKFDEKELAL